MLLMLNNINSFGWGKVLKNTKAPCGERELSLQGANEAQMRASRTSFRGALASCWCIFVIS